MKYLIKLILIYSVALFVSCTEKQNTEHSSTDPVANSNVKDSFNAKSFFSETSGEQEFKSRCITCHSLRYIQMQPPFPRKTWEKIVDKMIRNFGAPIPDSSAKAIVEYLVAVKGK